MFLAYFWYCDIYSLSSTFACTLSFCCHLGHCLALKAGLDVPIDPFNLLRCVSKGYQAALQRCSTSQCFFLSGAPKAYLLYSRSILRSQGNLD